MKHIFKIAYLKKGKKFYAFTEACDIYEAGFIFATRYNEIPDADILSITKGKQVKTPKGEQK